MALTYDVVTTSDSAAVTIYGLNTRYGKKEFEMRMFTDGTGEDYEVYDTITDPDTYDSSYTCPYTGLDPGTTYWFMIVVRTYDVSDLLTEESVPASGVGEFETDPSGGGAGGGGGGSVDLFDWDESNGSASAAQTRAAYAAVTDHGSVSDFSYLVWNDIVDKIMDWIGIHSEWEWYTSARDGPLTYNQTRMTASDRTMTADRLNSAVYNLRESLGGTIPDSWRAVSPGDPCLGSYFTDLVDYLNLAIETK